MIPVTHIPNTSYGLNAAIRAMFSNGEQGWWYDPSNFSTLFQDSAGTTPVTAVEQPVGLQLDLSGRGNHRRQSTSANRPVVSARVNLLTKTEQFDDAVWNAAAGNVTVSGNKIIPSATSGQHYVSQGSATSGVTHTIVVKAKQAGYTWLKLVAFNQYANFDLANGAVGTNFSGVSRSISAVGDGSYVCTFIFTSASSTGGQGCIIKVGTADNANWDSANFSGNGTDGIQLYYADLRVANIGVGLPAYQRVNTSTDYTSTGFPVYIKPNGSNQFMQTNSINFTATDKMTVWQGVRKLSATGVSFVAELSANGDTNNGSFGFAAPVNTSSYYFALRGTALSCRQPTTPINAPVTSVISANYKLSEIAANEMTVQVNSNAIALITASGQVGPAGTGNFGNYPAYFY